MTDIELLKKIDAFRQLDDNQLLAIKDCWEVVGFKQGDQLFKEGEDSRYLWVVIEGKVDLRYELEDGSSLSKGKLHFISEAQTFGWSCFVPPYKYRLSGYCVTGECSVIKIEKNCLLKLFEQNPDMGFHVMKQLVQVVGSHFNNFRDELSKQIGDDIMNPW